MVAQNMIIQCMDIYKGIVREESIRECFDTHIDKINYKTAGNKRIEYFGEKDYAVKVTDWKGWSDLILLEEIKSTSDMVHICTENGKNIICDINQAIPVYDPTKKKLGFHGETMYEHIYTYAKDVKVGDILRVRHCRDINDWNINFDKVCSVFIERTLGNTFQCYRIITKHGYCNCNDIYIIAQSEEDIKRNIEIGTIVRTIPNIPTHF